MTDPPLSSQAKLPTLTLMPAPRCLLPAICFGACLLLSGCFVGTDHPIRPVADAIQNDMILGNWKNPDGDTFRVTVDHRPWYQITCTSDKAQSTYPFYICQAGKEYYLNFKLTKDQVVELYADCPIPKSGDVYVLAHATFNRDNWSFGLLAQDDMKKIAQTLPKSFSILEFPVKSGSLAVKPLYVSASSEAWHHLLEESDPKTLFPNSPELVRIP